MGALQGEALPASSTARAARFVVELGVSCTSMLNEPSAAEVSSAAGAPRHAALV